MVANIEGFAGFTKRNRRNCEIFYAMRKNTLGLKPWLRWATLSRCVKPNIMSEFYAYFTAS